MTALQAIYLPTSIEIITVKGFAFRHGWPWLHGSESASFTGSTANVSPFSPLSETT